MEFTRARDEKTKRAKDAAEMYQTVVRNCEKAGSALPPYDFLELIGKGAFGRVYKGRSQSTGNLVAIKIATIDENDFYASHDQMDETIRDFRKEVATLQQLKDSKTKNVNVIHDAFDLHSQLWIIADYCTGGSVRTLLRPFERKGLQEEYIIPIARELIIALKGMHDLGLIHRDIKCSNVYVTEDGDIQLGDFGIVGVLEDGASSKRKTVVGTPHWLPKEIIHVMTGVETGEVQYGKELDIWSYGITLYEMATGLPPHSNMIGHRLAEAVKKPPRLEGDQYSTGLKDLIAFCLQPDQQARPTADDILEHHYLADTGDRFPTGNLVNLIEAFKLWEFGGGSRASLWMANATDFPVADDSTNFDDDIEDDAHSNDGWNFSTSESFDENFGKRLSMMVDQQVSSGAEQIQPSHPILSIQEQLRQEWANRSAERGEKSLERLFSPTGGYQLHTPVLGTPYTSTPAAHTPSESLSGSSDLPLRTYTNDAPTRESMVSIVDLDFATPDLGPSTTNSSAVFDFGNDLTLKGPSQYSEQDDDSYQPEQLDDRRATMEWKFPSEPSKRSTMGWTFATAGEIPTEPDEPDAKMHLPTPGDDSELPAGFRPRLDRTATEPVGHARDFSLGVPYPTASSASNVDIYRGSMIDLDAALSPDPVAFAANIGRSSTADSNSDSVKTDDTSGNPFDLEEDPRQNQMDADRFSYHKQWRSEGGHGERRSKGSRRSQMHARGNSVTSNDSDLDNPNSLLTQRYRSGGLSGNPLSIAYGESLTGDSWTNFDRFGPGPGPPQLNDFQFPFTNGLDGPEHYAGASHARAGSADALSRPQAWFPSIQAPDPRALAEGCDEAFLSDELSRQMETLADSLDALAKALGAHAKTDANPDESDFHLSDLDLDFASTREATEDEGESGTDRFSTRRKPRKLELRTPGFAFAPNSAEATAFT